MTKLPRDVQEGIASHYQGYLSEDNVEMEFRRIMKINDLGLRDLLLKQVVLAAKFGDSREAGSAELTKASLDPAQERYLSSLIPPEEEVEEVSFEDSASPGPVP